MAAQPWQCPTCGALHGHYQASSVTIDPAAAVAPISWTHFGIKGRTTPFPDCAQCHVEGGIWQPCEKHRPHLLAAAKDKSK